MATVRVWRKVVGIKVELTNDEVESLRDTIAALEALLSDARSGTRINAKTLTDMFDGDTQAKIEFDITIKMVTAISQMYQRAINEDLNSA